MEISVRIIREKEVYRKGEGGHFTKQKKKGLFFENPFFSTWPDEYNSCVGIFAKERIYEIFIAVGYILNKRVKFLNFRGDYKNINR